ncbi:hypothetical protein [Pseudosulfitobacter pseudonitzschiae]|uniref:hypothetical protein n=1 Tax=Pseudosulfitobacter pseudonitzschiae TaxID=1402135 RepID=UPI001AF63E77|nr:hypothetical protein [Pseudosulfitobacter pseudonitzschiae]MBM1817144.1 hypothetical protein [Pseudosulfitobacter pseudonitzschiae]MBM1834147.1 hypothetical protein [Pseudosulfitobacter pseudonitzschiae]MBM1839012.1 hypothetical protein [Pseudosulfitobacter pseudonitzschiae]MBM1843862.1 hypothetical protein [Pseudosulfitobacter pseudonitzschiae]MBM1848708.1 hypothetical protein [Pseudosulfitobacter pseudonitzschiae]
MTDISARLRAVTEDDAYAQPFTFAVTCREAADHIDAQAATIKALVEALEIVNRMTTYPVCASIDPRGYGIMPATKDGMELIAETARAALAAAKETT